MHQYCPTECLSNKQCFESDWGVYCRHTHTQLHSIRLSSKTNLVVPKSNLSKNSTPICQLNATNSSSSSKSTPTNKQQQTAKYWFLISIPFSPTKSDHRSWHDALLVLWPVRSGVAGSLSINLNAGQNVRFGGNWDAVIWGEPFSPDHFPHRIIGQIRFNYSLHIRQ